MHFCTSPARWQIPRLIGFALTWIAPPASRSFSDKIKSGQIQIIALMDRLNLNEKSILDTFSLFPAEAELIQKKTFMIINLEIGDFPLNLKMLWINYN